MSLDVSALSSISASLDDLTERISQLIAEATEDEDALVELREIERQLQTSTRRLTKVVRRASS